LSPAWAIASSYWIVGWIAPGAPVSAVGAAGRPEEQRTARKHPSRGVQVELVDRYMRSSGRDVEPLAWFEALALWKAAVFCEAIYGRYVRGELTSDDGGAKRFETGVPLLAETAAELVL